VWFWSSALAALLALWVSAARAQDARRVLVFESASAGPLERELEIRLKAELAAAGFEVVALPRADAAGAQRDVTALGAEYEPLAAFAIVEEQRANAGGGPSSLLRLWLSDRKRGSLQQLEREHALPGSRAASTLAVQGVEWLRARVLELQRPAPEPAPAPIALPLPAPPPAPAPRLIPAIDLGVLLDGATGGAALTPLLRLGYVSEAGALGMGARLSLAGLGTATVLETALRQVEVDQSFALLEAVATLEVSSWLRPMAVAGAGAYRVSVHGVAPTPLVGRSEVTVSALGSLGVGVLLRPFGAWVGKLEAQSLFALQPTAVEIESTRIATFGRPLWVFSAGLGVAL
jgi:hypothetical protein